MCGVIGLITDHHREDLGVIGAELLKTLEYRGYDSTGAAFQGDDESIVLRKGVGAPSVMVNELGIIGLSGSIMCGQVRWATFGAVDDVNAQPHEVFCKTHLYGAHNGNVTNSDDLKAWLTAEGHHVLSDNDGEMVVHTVEHFFADGADRRAAIRAAIVKASARLEGSYAAVIVDPATRTLWAIKRGSSLYFGIGRGLSLASSDLSSVLKLTRVVVPMSEGELVEYTADSYQLYSTADGRPIERQPVRSRLQARDAELLPQFTSYMEQEIDAQEETCRRIAALFRGETRAEPYRDELIQKLRDEYDDERIQQRFRELVASPKWQALLHPPSPGLRPPSPRTQGEGEQPAVPPRPAQRGEGPRSGGEGLVSLEAGLLSDLLEMAKTDAERQTVHLLDAIFEAEEIREFRAAVDEFVRACTNALDTSGRVFFVCCGSSYHAALAGAVFFNEIAHSEIVPVLPGEFRGRFEASLRPNDLVVAVSQSGETKDLIDVMNAVIRSGLPIRRIAIVNNVSSTLGQEKCDTVLPLRCGPEIAVPATKSYINQLAMMYGLAQSLSRAQRGISGGTAKVGSAVAAAPMIPRSARDELLLDELPRLVRATLDTTREAVDEAAKLLYLKPSMHILATRLLAIAKEGALKIREVVLNHTEGFEGSEFKHGPNTILGVNTIFGLDDVQRYVERGARDFADLYSDYPLIFVTGPDETDVNLTVSQINTHKIRGTTCVMVAEESAALRQAVTKPPADNPNYRAVYIALPASGDNLMTIFTATVVLQRLALRMSVLKQQHLDRLGFKDHGVHPDVPKNVSKSITVD